MPASEAQMAANQANAAKSTGPKTPEGKERSRQNSYKHGLTGDGVVMPPEEAAEVEKLCAAFRVELQPTCAIGLTLIRRAATLAVRMEKASEREIAATSDRVAKALAEFEAPEDASPAEIARLRAQVIREASFDVSKEGCLARSYEAAAERGFYRALKEFRSLEPRAGIVDREPSPEEMRRELASLLGKKLFEDLMESEAPKPALPVVRNPYPSPLQTAPITSSNRVDVPFTIGRRR